MLKKHGIWTFSILYYNQKEMSYIQFCRASQALSIGIWLNLKSEKIHRKKITKTLMVNFWHFLGSTWGVWEVGPSYPSIGKSLYRNTLDYSMA